MNLLYSPYSPGIRKLLACLDTKTLRALAATATKSRILPDTNKEAVEIILRYTENVDRLLSYRSLTSQVLFDYLHKRRVTVKVGDSKLELQERVKKEWEKSYGEIEASEVVRVYATPTPQPITRPTINTIMNVNLTLQIPPSTTTTHHQAAIVRSNVFVREFCTWFYIMINRLQPQCSAINGDTFTPDAFMGNCSMDVFLCGPQTADKHVTGNTDAYQLLKGVCMEYRLCFVPHLENGVQVIMSDHGLLKLFCCGTLQQGEAMVGVFEQEFGLVKSPDNKWKILMTRVNLKQAQGIASLPAIPKSLVFDIPA